MPHPNLLRRIKLCTTENECKCSLDVMKVEKSNVTSDLKKNLMFVSGKCNLIWQAMYLVQKPNSYLYVVT